MSKDLNRRHYQNCPNVGFTPIMPSPKGHPCKTMWVLLLQYLLCFGMQAILSIFSQPAMTYCLNMTIIQTFSLKSTSFGAFFAQKILVCITLGFLLSQSGKILLQKTAVLGWVWWSNYHSTLDVVNTSRGSNSECEWRCFNWPSTPISNIKNN